MTMCLHVNTATIWHECNQLYAPHAIITQLILGGKMLITLAQNTLGDKAVLKLKKLGYLSIFSAPLIFMASIWLGSKFGVLNYAAWFTLFFIYCVVPLLDIAVGSEYVDPGKFADDLNLKNSRFYTALLILCIPLELLMIFICGNVFFNYDLSLIGKAGVLCSLGFISGSLAINVSHELVHRLDKRENWAGGLCSLPCVLHRLKSTTSCITTSGLLPRKITLLHDVARQFIVT